MIRWVFNIFALLSFLLCVATVVLWVRSYEEFDSFFHSYEDSRGSWELGSSSGEVYVTRMSHPQGLMVVYDDMVMRAFPAIFGIDIFEYARGDQIGWYAGIPHPMLAYIFAGLPILWCFSTFRRQRVKRRLKNNLCVACGYDLQGSGGKCPECGVGRLQSL